MMDEEWQPAYELCEELDVEPNEVITLFKWVDFARVVLDMVEAGTMTREEADLVMLAANDGTLDDKLQELSHWYDIWTMQATELLAQVRKDSTNAGG